MNQYFLSTGSFLLQSPTARKLYHKYAASMPILDYHCHLSPKEIWENQPYSSITLAWLGADHYKWRLMRSNGIPEEKITGKADDREKFFAWAETLPYCIGNPLYHWTHLELQRYFSIDEPLCANSAARIWEQCNQKLSTKGFLPRELVNRSRVELLCTTDDPADGLEYHQKIQADPTIRFEVLPCFRPDAALAYRTGRFFAVVAKTGRANE